MDRVALRPEAVRDTMRNADAKMKWHKTDCPSLYLVHQQGRGFWVLHFRDPREGGAIRNHGLGSADTLTPAAARRKAQDFMSDLRNGRPVAIATHKAKGQYSARPLVSISTTTPTNGRPARGRTTRRYSRATSRPTLTRAR